MCKQYVKLSEEMEEAGEMNESVLNALSNEIAKVEKSVAFKFDELKGNLLEAYPGVDLGPN